MKNALKEKPYSYHDSHGFVRYLMDYIKVDDFKGKNVLDAG